MTDECLDRLSSARLTAFTVIALAVAPIPRWVRVAAYALLALWLALALTRKAKP